jgi:hypothetical protein
VLHEQFYSRHQVITHNAAAKASYAKAMSSTITQDDAQRSPVFARWLRGRSFTMLLVTRWILW